MKKLFFTLCALCLCGTMWADETGTVYKDVKTSLYFAEVTYTGANSATALAIVAVPEGEEASYSIDNLIKNDDGTYTLPATVQAEGGEEQALTGVGASAFASALTDTNNPIHLVIPASINYMGQSAFQKCTQIEEVTVAYSETDLDEAHNVSYGNSFSGCSNLKVVTQNRNITLHRNNENQVAYICFPFADLPSIATVYIGEKVTALGNNAYNARTTCNLKEVYCYATDHVPTLDHNCFLYQAEDCTLYVYDELVETFKADVNGTNGWGDIFSNIQGMGSPELEEGTYLDLATSLYFEINEDGTTASIYHDEAGIYTDENLVPHATITDAYTLPETVSADGETYYDVTRIEANAFESSSISGHLVIPAHIVNMGESAFYNCTGIEKVTYEYSKTPLKEENDGIDGANMTGGSFQGCTGITTVNLYRDIEYLSSLQQPGAFVGTTSVATINIGPRVTKIPDYMFRNTTNAYNGGGPIKTINCYAVEPPTLGLAPFARLGENTLNVPQGTMDAYRSASVWSDQINGTATDQNYNVCTFQEMTNAFAITTHANDEGTAYATFYNSASNVELFNPDGDTELTAYAAYALDKEDDGLYIDIVGIGSSVPAATGAIVETATAGTYLAIATGDKTSYSGNNNLYGYDTATKIDNPSGNYYYYLLSSTENGVVGFYWGADEGGVFECQAHRAYLALLSTAVSNATHISIRKGNGGDDTTGISSVESATEGASVKGIYTIQGVRVSNMNQPGLYIVDGKKVLVK